MSYAQASDVERELGRPAKSTAETRQWDAWLDRVERSIIRVFRRAGLVLDAAVAAGDPTEQDVIDVLVGAVIRKIQNPTWGETSRTESHGIDDANGSYTTRNEGAGAYADPLALTPDEIASLLPSGHGKRPRAFSVMPS